MKKPLTLWQASRNLKAAFEEFSELLPKAEDALPNMLGATKKAEPEPELYFIDYAVLPIRYLLLPAVKSVILDQIRSEYKKTGELPPGVGILNNEELDNGETEAISAQENVSNVGDIRPGASDGGVVAGDSPSGSGETNLGGESPANRSKNKKAEGKNQ